MNRSEQHLEGSKDNGGKDCRFEWNLMHAKVMTRLSASFEGVLDRPGRIPAYSIDLVVASGAESDRERVERHLADGGVLFDMLIMQGGRGKEDVLSSFGPDLHLSGPSEEAERIVSGTGIPTISLDEMRLLGSIR